MLGILHAGKDVENRDWQPNAAHLARARSIIAGGGRVLIHASKGMTEAELGEGLNFIDRAAPRDGSTDRRARRVRIMADSQDHRGGIVGAVTVVDVVTASDSPWFFGPVGLVLRDARPLPFVPCNGMLGFWRVPADVMQKLAWTTGAIP